MPSPELLRALLGSAVHSAAESLLREETLEEYLKRELPLEMRKHRGKKRLRKKKALKVLLRWWGARIMFLPLSRRLGYGAIGNMLFQVEPLSGAMTTFTFTENS